MAGIENSTVSLRIFGDDLDPEEVTRLLRCLPTQSRRKGEVIPGKGMQRVARQGSWLLESNLPRSVDLEAQINNLIDRTTADLDTWASLSQRFSVDLFCGVFLTHLNEGFELSAKLMRQLSDRGLKIGFDLYALTKDV
jgi:Domain of unknown function (DUF4279)